MRLLQNTALYRSYVPFLRQRTRGCTTYADYMSAFLSDRFGAVHYLQPVLQRNPAAMLVIGNDAHAQRMWAREHGLSAKASPDEVLLAQIEEHRAEVFYNNDPVTFPGSFARRLPGCVKLSVAWRAAPSGRTDFRGYGVMVCNFPGILASYRDAGLTTAYFAPAIDPEMTPYADHADRPVDIAFVGSFSRHHSQRTAVLEAVALLADRLEVALHLESSNITRWFGLPLVRHLVPRPYRMPDKVRRLARPPAFGRDLYTVLSRAKIVINGAIDMSGQERGNMRCFESMGLGSLLLSDEGVYPPGMDNGETMVTYSGLEDMAAKAQMLLTDLNALQSISKRGTEVMRNMYSKQRQWEDFGNIVNRFTA